MTLQLPLTDQEIEHAIWDISCLRCFCCQAAQPSLSVVGVQAATRMRANQQVVASDSAITSEIQGKYGADSGVSMFNIGVRTHSGIVTLTGSVANYVARDQAGRIAKATTGVTAVNNQIVVEK